MFKTTTEFNEKTMYVKSTTVSKVPIKPNNKKRTKWLFGFIFILQKSFVKNQPSRDTIGWKVIVKASTEIKPFPHLVESI